MNALPKTSEFVTAPAKVISPRKAWMLLSLLLSFPVYMLVSLIYIQSTQGWIFIDPGIYQAGVGVSAVVAVLLIYSMRGRGSVFFSNVLVLMLGTFPVLLMLLVPLLSVAPLRMVHTLLPHDDVVKSLRVELFTSCGSGRRSSSNPHGVVFEEGFGFLNDKNCKLPFWLVGELRKADELSWRIERSAIGFSLVKLERVTRGGDMVIDASWRGVRRH